MLRHEREEGPTVGGPCQSWCGAVWDGRHFTSCKAQKNPSGCAEQGGLHHLAMAGFIYSAIGSHWS